MRSLRLAAFALALGLACEPTVGPNPFSATPTPEEPPSPSTVVATTPAPSFSPVVSCVPSATADNPEPTHAPVDGQPDLGVPVLAGVIDLQIAQCHDITALLTKYGLAGPAIRLMPGVTLPESATRWFRVTVPGGSESAKVVSLWTHRDDFDHVSLVPAFRPSLSMPSGTPSAAPVTAEEAIRTAAQAIFGVNTFELFSLTPGSQPCDIHGGGPAPGIVVPGECRTAVSPTASGYLVIFTEARDATRFHLAGEPSSGTLSTTWTFEVGFAGTIVSGSQSGSFPPQAVR